jgi:hypothetical protein
VSPAKRQGQSPSLNYTKIVKADKEKHNTKDAGYLAKIAAKMAEPKSKN